MKRLSLRARLTIWYTVVMMFFFTISGIVILEITKTTLTRQDVEKITRSATHVAYRIAVSQERARKFFRPADEELLPDNLFHVLYNMDGRWLDGRQLLWVDAVSEEPERIRTVVHDGQPWLFLDKIVRTRSGAQIGRLRTVMSVAPTQKAMDQVIRAWLFSLVPCLALSVLGGLLIAGRALKPIRTITRTAREIGHGDLSKRIALTGSQDEVGELALAFNTMADNLEDAFEREKQFSSDASHEMRTPIAVIMASAEDAVQSDHLDTYRQATGVILEKSRQMQRMLSQLLILARGNEQAGAMEREPISLSTVIADIVAETTEQAAKKQIFIHTDLAADITIHADLLLFTRMLINLLDNAIHYGRPGGQIHIRTQKIPTENRVEIAIADDGMGIDPADLPHIFDRFYRADKVRSGAGAGLGLSFVDLIVRLHNGKIRVESTPGKGSTFTLALPMAY
ncbi:HAMP domain-containing histidine kinase [Desulfosarcina sp. OttesenSCG-928-A07]|nr:HAMP domain-containing histidine kinase [Desulfosarcina sp. OttesenSCG-928-A07]